MGSGAVGSLATGAAPRVVAVIPVAEAPTVAVVVWTINAVELEVYIVVAIADIAPEAVSVKTVVANGDTRAFLDEVDMDGSIVNAPVDVVGYIVPRGAAVVVYPVA